jgi:hypothetical protein
VVEGSTVEVTISSKKQTICSFEPLHYDQLPDPESPIQRLMFETPVKIAKDTKYVISTLQTGPNTRSITNAKRKVEKNTVHFCFLQADEDTNSTDTFSGQIPVIFFTK